MINNDDSHGHVCVQFMYIISSIPILGMWKLSVKEAKSVALCPTSSKGMRQDGTLSPDGEMGPEKLRNVLEVTLLTEVRVNISPRGHPHFPGKIPSERAPILCPGGLFWAG